MNNIERLVVYLEKTGAKLVELGDQGVLVRFPKGLKDARTALMVGGALRELGSVDNLSMDQYERLQRLGLIKQERAVEPCPARAGYEHLDAYWDRLKGAKK